MIALVKIITIEDLLISCTISSTCGIFLSCLYS